MQRIQHRQLRRLPHRHPRSPHDSRQEEYRDRNEERTWRRQKPVFDVDDLDGAEGFPVDGEAGVCGAEAGWVWALVRVEERGWDGGGMGVG